MLGPASTLIAQLAPCCTRKRYKQRSAAQPQPTPNACSAATYKASKSQSHIACPSFSVRSCAREHPAPSSIGPAFSMTLQTSRVTRGQARRGQSQSLSQTKEEHESLPLMSNSIKLVLVSSPRPNARAPSTPNSSAGAKHITRKLNQTARTYCQPLHNHPLSPTSTHKHAQH